MNETPEILFERACQGDRDAYWRLVLPYRGLVYSVAYGMMKNREQAEDLLHDVLLAALGALGNLRKPDRLGSWLYTMTRNRAIDVLRRDQRLRHVLHRAAAEVVPLGELFDKESWLVRMEAALTALPEPFRVILALKYMNEYSCQQIAEFLDTTIPAVKSRLFEARKLLRSATEALATREEKGMTHG